MKSIRGYDEAAGAIGAFDFHEFSLIEKMSFQVVEGPGCPVQEVELQMRTERRDPAAQIRLRFIGVQKLRIEDWPSGEVSLASFEVLDIRDRQLEELNWHIQDYEQDAITFLCRSVEIVSASHVDVG